MGIDKLNEWRPPSIVNINCVVEGFLDTGTGKHSLRDTLTAELRNSTSPYAIASTTKSVIDSVSFLGTFNFPHVNPGNYYISIHGRNSLETWSANSISISNDTEASYDFTSSSSQAYGGNLVSKGSEYCIYSGDVDNDGLIQISPDATTVYNDAVNFATGYLVTDVDGNNMTDLTDVAITATNAYFFVSAIKP